MRYLSEKNQYQTLENLVYPVKRCLYGNNFAFHQKKNNKYFLVVYNRLTLLT
jgi:hypothetical protein